MIRHRRTGSYKYLNSNILIVFEDWWTFPGQQIVTENTGTNITITKNLNQRPRNLTCLLHHAWSVLRDFFDESAA